MASTLNTDTPTSNRKPTTSMSQHEPSGRPGERLSSVCKYQVRTHHTRATDNIHTPTLSKMVSTC